VTLSFHVLARKNFQPRLVGRGLDAIDPLFDQFLTKSTFGLVFQEDFRSSGRGIGGNCLDLRQRLRFGIGDLVLRLLGPALHEFRQTLMRFLGKQFSFSTGLCDKGFGFGFGVSPALLEGGEQGGGFLAQADRFGELVTDPFGTVIKCRINLRMHTKIEQDADKDQKSQRDVKFFVYFHLANPARFLAFAFRCHGMFGPVRSSGSKTMRSLASNSLEIRDGNPFRPMKPLFAYALAFSAAVSFFVSGALPTNCWKIAPAASWAMAVTLLIALAFISAMRVSAVSSLAASSDSTCF